MQTILYIQLNVFTVLLCILLLWHNHKNKHKVMSKKTIQYILLLVCVVVILNSISWILEGNPNSEMRMVFFIILELEFVLQILPCFMMLVYTQENEGNPSDIQQVIRLLPLVLGAAIMVVNIWIPFVFRINESNSYERLAGFYLVGSIPVVYLLWSLVNCIIAYRRTNSEKKNLYFQYIVLLLFPIVGTLIQIVVYGMETRWMLTTLGFIYIYIHYQRNREQKLLQELSDIKVATMLSQIQYHFVFNTLSTIELYCMEDPKYASKMLECFQRYLRYNLEAINRTGFVHFKEELEHTKRYLALEKMRFAKHFTVQYDIQEEDFFIPVLSLQPIVEHAVRYGVCKSEEAGMVMIQTKKVGKSICLSVEDTGRAQDVDHISVSMEDNQEFFGIMNVKKRIESISRGEMDLYSRKTRGTLVTVYIPL